MGDEPKYRDELPIGCPPEDAQEISAPRVVYYFVSVYPPSDSDFLPVAMQRDVAASEHDFCCAHGLSVFNTPKQCAAGPGKLESFQSHMICGLHLDAGAGRIKKTGRSRGHHTFWPYATFNLIQCCKPLP